MVDLEAAGFDGCRGVAVEVTAAGEPGPDRVEAVLTPVFVIFYNLHPLGDGWLFFAILPLGSWALVANGVFFAALSLRARSRELLLPLVLFPIFIPALLAMVLAATNVLTGESDPGLWVKMLVGYDIIFTVLSLLLFETVLHAE